MKKTLSRLLLVTALPLAVEAQNINQLTDTEKQEGWQLLFDGNSTTGWHLFNVPDRTGAWKVIEGALSLDNQQKEGRGDLVTNQEFGDFDLKFEWKIAPQSNSGLIFLVQEGLAHKATWHTGPEYQLIDNVHYPEKLKPKQMSGSLYDLVACPASYAKPAGEWNTGEIRLEKGKLSLFLNQREAVKTRLWNKEWNKMVAGSKFINENMFAVSKIGRIALQDHGGQVWFRNIKIKTL